MRWLLGHAHMAPLAVGTSIVLGDGSLIAGQQSGGQPPDSLLDLVVRRLERGVGVCAGPGPGQPSAARAGAVSPRPVPRRRCRIPRPPGRRGQTTSSTRAVRACPSAKAVTSGGRDGPRVDPRRWVRTSGADGRRTDALPAAAPAGIEPSCGYRRRQRDCVATKSRGRLRPKRPRPQGFRAHAAARSCGGGPPLSGGGGPGRRPRARVGDGPAGCSSGRGHGELARGAVRQHENARRGLQPQRLAQRGVHRGPSFERHTDTFP